VLRARPPRHIRWRPVVAVVLIVVGCVLTPVSLVAVWTHDEVSNTDTFVSSVGPLVDDPAVQEALTNRITITVFQYVDVKQLADDSISALAAQGLPQRLAQRLAAFTPAIAAATTSFVRDKVGQLVASPQFANVWNQAIRIAHQQAVSTLSGQGQGVVVQGGTVYLDLAPFIDAAKQQLSANGLTAVNAIPEVHPQIALASADQLVRARSVYSLLDGAATVLPWITLLILAVGVYLARGRARATIAACLGIALALVVPAAGLLVARGLLVGAVPPAGAPAAASGFDIVVQSLRDSGRVLLVLVLVVAGGAFLAGPSPTAQSARRHARELLHRIRGGPAAMARSAPGCGPTCAHCGSEPSRSPRWSSCSSHSRQERRS
jgi:hypothetical protein